MFFQGELGTFAKLEAVANGFGKDDAAGFVDRIKLDRANKNRRAEAQHYHTLAPMEMTRRGINRLDGGGGGL
jgi:hypothetical protein